MSQLKVGIIGAGGIARGRHIPCFQRNQKAALVAIADVAEGAAERVAREFGIPAFYTSYQDMIEKEAVLQAGTRGVFDMAHFEGYPAVLIELRIVGKRALKELIVDGWLACAPPALAESYLRKR